MNSENDEFIFRKEEQWKCLPQNWTTKFNDDSCLQSEKAF